MSCLLTHCHLVSPDVERDDVAILLEDGLVAAIHAAGEALPPADEIRDLAGATVVPGFLDIHCHGRGGADFCDGTLDAIATIGEGKLHEGVTGFLATTLTVSVEQLEATFEAAAQYCAQPTGAKLLGIHLEGPFLNPDCAGAQNPAFIRLPDLALVDRLSAICPIRKVSFSPELPGSIEFIQGLAERGIMPSGAHSAADYAQFCAARDAGMRHLTHFCNVMTPVHHLRFGMVGGGLRSPDVLVEIIADGIHLCPEMIDLIFALKTCDGVMLITDAMRGAAMPDGDYELGGLPVTVTHGKAQLADGTVAGSTLQLHQGLQRVREITGLPLKELLKTTGWNQARSLNLGNLGRIEPGASADLLVLDEPGTPSEIWVDGKRQELMA
jgi:N-acetylglucosamine-6-phosphate deacetylase